MTRILGRKFLPGGTPFEGEGVSLYANFGTEVVYTRPMFLCDRGLLPGGDSSRLRSGEEFLPRTERVAFALSPEDSIDFEYPPEWEGETIAVNVRTFKDGIENEDLSVRAIALSEGGEIVESLDGEAEILSIEARDGGIVVIRWRWRNTGTVTPDTFSLIRTDGPTTPDPIVLDDSGDGEYEYETLELEDSAPYTFKIQAAGGMLTADVLTGIAVQADASGPIAPTGGSAVAW